MPGPETIVRLTADHSAESEVTDQFANPSLPRCGPQVVAWTNSV